MNNINILLVEDETYSAMAVQTVLAGRGYTVVKTVSTADDAVRFAKEMEPDLIIMDIVLKGEKDGITAVEEIRSYRDIPVIYVTAHSDERTMERVRETEPYGYIVKPMNRDELYSVIEIALYRHRMESRLRETEAEKERLNRELTERVKELDCLYSLSRLVDEPHVTLDEILQGTAEMLPGSWQYPDIARARICYDGRTFVSSGFRESRWKQSADICVEGTVSGTVQIFYLEERPGEEEGPFLAEERNLLKALAERLGKIIERKGAEEVIAERNRLIEALMEGHTDVVCLIDQQGRILDLNEVTSRRFGRTPEEMKGTVLYEYFPDEVAARRRAQIESVFETGQAFRGQDSREGMWNDYVIYPVRNGSGRVEKTAVIARDITDRMEKTKRYREAVRDWRETFDSLDDMTAVISPDYTIERINRKGSELIGSKFSEIIGKKCYRMIFGRNEPCDFCPLGKGVSEGGAATAEVSLPESGKYYSIKTTPVFDDDGNVVRFVDLLRDITEYKRKEEQLMHKEEKYRGLFEDSLDMIHVVDPSGIIIDANRAELERLGYSREEYLGRELLDIIHPDYRDETGNAFKKVSLGEMVRNYRTALKTKHGEDVNVEVSAFPKMERGRVVQVRAIIRDIEHQVAMEKMLMQGQKQYRLLVENLHEGIWTIDREGHTDFVNPRMADMLGYEPEEMNGRHLFDFMDDQGVQIAKMLLIRRQQGIDEQHDFEFMHKNGSRVFASLETTILHDEDGNYAGALAAVSDITARKQMEREVREREERYKLITGSIRDMFFCLDGDLVCTFWNRASEEISGIPGEKALGRPITELFPDMAGAPVTEFYRRVYETGEPGVQVISYPIKGKERFFEIRAYPLEGGLSVFSTDITEKRESEERLKHSLAEKELLLREIHHRVKNNMQVISSLIDLHSDFITDGPALEVFEETKNRIRTMAIVHEQLYRSHDFSMIDFRDYMVQLTESVHNTYYDLNKDITMRSEISEVHLSIDQAIPCALIANELVSNAYKHAYPEGGGEIVISMEIEGGFCRLTVSDHGAGLPEGFDMEGAETMGMQLVTALIDQLDGTVTVDGGEGTSITVLFQVDET